MGRRTDRPQLLVIGSGIIGTDLVRRLSAEAPDLDVSVLSRSMSGLTRRRLEEAGATTWVGPFESLDATRRWDIIADASDAHGHRQNSRQYLQAASYVIDLTPSGFGTSVFPSLLDGVDLAPGEYGMVSCGAQASVPVVSRLADVQPIDYVEVITSGASSAAGRATRANLDEYVESTQDAVRRHCAGEPDAKVMINLRPGSPQPPFRVTLYIESALPWTTAARDVVDRVALDMGNIAHGYAMTQIRRDGRVLKVGIEVKAVGHGLPAHFGSVEVINANAVELIVTINRSDSSSGRLAEGDPC